MTYLEAVMIVEKEIERHKRMAMIWEVNGSATDFLKADDERILIDALETIIREVRKIIMNIPTIDAVQVVRCKNCKYWRDKQILLYDGTYRDYEPGEYENGSLFGCGVTSDIGINVGSRCMRREFNGDSWYCKEDDFCSYGEKKDE